MYWKLVQYIFHLFFYAFFFMNTERNYQANAIYQKEKSYYAWLELPKLLLWLREILNEIVFSRRLHTE